MRVIAVDWSGNRDASARNMWLGEARDGRLLRLENGRDREAVVEHLIALAREDPQLAVGLDFAFSAPDWYLRQLGVDAPGLWRLAAEKGEDWLRDCEPPFWGRPGRKRPDLPDHFRIADRLDVAGISPKSVFQISGAGSVGTGSVRGWALLPRLREAGFAIYPFDPPSLPVAVEIYPRALTGPVTKSSAAERREYMRERYRVDAAHFAAVESSEDAFDAAVSAIVMSQHAESFTQLPPINDPRLRLEGVIWNRG